MSNPTPRSPLNRDTTTLAEATPWYLNDTLSDADREWFEAELARDERLANALKFDEQIASTLERRADEVPANLGWDKLLRRVRADETQPIIAAAPGLGAKLADFFSGFLTPGVGAAMAAVLVAQTVAIGFLVDNEPAPVEYRSVGGLRPTPVIRAMLNESVTGKQLRESLSAQGASIVSGPTQLGEYLLRLDSDADRSAVAEALKESGVLVSFSLDTQVIGQ